MLDAQLHLVERSGLPAQTVDLRQPGDARPDFVPDHVALDQAAVHLVVRHGVGARADDAHAALEHVEKLGQLVERELPQKRAETGYAPVVARGLLDDISIFEHGHRAELVDDDLLAVESVAALLEQRRPGRAQLYADCNDEHEGQYQGEDRRCKDDVAHALDQTVDPVEGGFAGGEDRNAADRIHARLDQIEQEDVRHEVDRGRRVVQLVEQLENAGLRSHGQRDVDQIDVMCFHVRRDLTQRAEVLAGVDTAEALGAAIVEKTGQADA